jgi:acyl-CoA dehydrogenase
MRNLTPSERARTLLDVTREFMETHVYPAEPIYEAQRAELSAAGMKNTIPPVMADLKREARRLGLWNLFLPAISGLSNVDYCLIAEETGRSPWLGPSAMNCSSPDSGNMELLSMFANEQQRSDWLEPLLNDDIRSAFSMTEPGVASSDARNIQTSIRADGADIVINGRKWFSTGAADPRCKLLIVVGRNQPVLDPKGTHSIVLVPRDTYGVTIRRVLPVYGFFEQQGHAEIEYSDVRVPMSCVLGNLGDGFAMAQARLGPGRIHHCMRAIGMAERALELACRRALSRTAFGDKLAGQGTVRAQIAEARISIDQMRLLVMHAARVIDEDGSRAARRHVAAAKAVVPKTTADIIDRAIQIHGAAGVTPDTPLAMIWTRARTLRIVDGPDDVHLRMIASAELHKYANG